MSDQSEPGTGRRRGADGLRRSTEAARRAGRLADGFRGLPDGVTRWRLAAALRAAAGTLGLTASTLRLLQHYIDLTYDDDWATDSEPVVTRPLVEIAEHLGLSERQVRNLERALVEKGLLVWRDSGNHHRKGRRDRATGRLIYAYGPSLAPLGARADEIIACARSARADAADKRRLRIAISALRRRIRAGLAEAAENGAPTADLQRRFDATPPRMPAGLEHTILAGRRDQLSAIAAELAERTGADAAPATPTPIQPGPEISALPAPERRHETDTDDNHAMNGVSAARPSTARTMDHGVTRVPIALALTAAGPLLRAATGAEKRHVRWPDLIDAAAHAAPLIGIDDPLWREACARLGRPAAALAILVIERAAERTDMPGGGIRRPTAYLRGLMERGAAGGLHLDRSIRSWARREDADRRAPPYARQGKITVDAGAPPG